MKVTAIIAAAGQGARMGGGKQFLDLGGAPVVGRTLGVFESCGQIDEIILVVNQKDIELAKKTVKRLNIGKVKKIAAGGGERQDSVLAGLNEVKPDTDIVVIHDGARPFVTNEIISRAVNDAQKHGAAVVAVPVIDTLKSSKEDGFVSKTVERANMWQAQTPQAFKFDIITKAYEQAKNDGYKATDDSQLVERTGLPVKITMGDYGNIKITTKNDLAVARNMIREINN